MYGDSAYINENYINNGHLMNTDEQNLILSDSVQEKLYNKKKEL